LFAEKEEREIQALVMKVISLELKKLELKLKHFSEIEETLDRERIQVNSIQIHPTIPHFSFID
jgi:SWI/SNF related-matrix-associated actin-dependent regulator of chromatin subfamily C